MRVIGREGKHLPWALAADLPVVDDSQAVVGFLDERDVARV
jgi:hypothetical protein